MTYSASSVLSRLVVSYPWIPILFLLPICIVYDIYSNLKLRFNVLFRRRNGRHRHEEKVRHIQEQVQGWQRAGSQVPMCTARPGYQSITLQSLTYKKRLHKIEVDLPDILSVDTARRTVKVEPMVTIGQLNDYLIAMGWTLPVVPELDDLTIGGLVMGGGIETTSHKYGLFQCICKSYELILADGSRVSCSAKERPELYSAIPFSYGTLGFLTAVDLDIVPYKPYIRLQYIPVYSLDEAVTVFKRETEDPANDSVEGIMYSLEEGVVMSGVFVDEVGSEGRVNKIGRWYKPWFYKHAETFLKKGMMTNKLLEYIPTYDFFHRHNRCCFWLLGYIVPFGNHAIFRYLFGWTLPPKHAMIKLLKENFVPERSLLDRFVAQDFGVKMEDLRGMLEVSDKETAVYPVWLCPMRHFVPEGLEHLRYFRKAHLQIDVDVGVYGFCLLPTFDKVETQRKLERFVLDQKGFVALYAETQLSREEFEEMVDLENYERVRKELKCELAFPHVYEKISKLGRK